jgi:hypothetical protein
MKVSTDIRAGGVLESISQTAQQTGRAASSFVGAAQRQAHELNLKAKNAVDATWLGLRAVIGL